MASAGQLVNDFKIGDDVEWNERIYFDTFHQNKRRENLLKLLDEEKWIAWNREMCKEKCIGKKMLSKRVIEQSVL